MSKTISRLYNSHAEARAAVRQLEAAGVSHGSISILVSNADSAYDEKTKSFPDRDSMAGMIESKARLPAEVSVLLLAAQRVS